jgi:large subunit ribosomal protein L35
MGGRGPVTLAVIPRISRGGQFKQEARIMKLKSHSGASKRFHKTGTGKFMRKKAGKRHILTGKNRERKRRLSGSVVVDSTSSATLGRLLPYQ